jgi:hypothetical protein
MACTRPPGGGGRPTTTMPDGMDHDHGGGGGPSGPQDCGTITIGDGVTAAENASATCFMGYHTFATKDLKTIKVEGSTTSVWTYHAQSHNMTITKTVTTNGVAGPTQTKHCSGLAAQIIMGGTGVPNTQPGSITNCTIP